MNPETDRPIFAEDLFDELARLRAKVLRQGNIIGAAAALLDAIHRSGGYQVHEPEHRDSIGRAMQALEGAVLEALNV